jgi:DNA invertase Pin-like site-specific DNA recombinase
MNRPLIAYLRVAPRERAGERPGLDAQREALERAARERGWEIVAVQEDVRSGRTLRRPGLRAALAACRGGEAQGIAVARLDRLTYSLIDLAEIVREAVDGGFTIVSLQPDVDLSAGGGRAVGEVLAEAATWQPRAITTAGRALAGRPGRPSSTPPAVAARIRELRGRGMTLQAICDTLNAERIPTPRGGAEWRPTSLRSVLR